MFNMCFSNLPINRLAYEITIFLIIAVLFIYMTEIVYIQRKKSLRIPKVQSESYIEEGQTTQWTKDTKGVIRIRISKKNIQHNGQKIPKGQSESVYRRRTDNTTANRKSTKWQRSTKHTHKTIDRVARAPLKTLGELRCHGRVSSSCSTSSTRLRCAFS